MASPAYLLALSTGIDTILSHDESDDGDSDGETSLDTVSPLSPASSGSSSVGECSPPCLSPQRPPRTALDPSRQRLRGHSADSLLHKKEVCHNAWQQHRDAATRKAPQSAPELREPSRTPPSWPACVKASVSAASPNSIARQPGKQDSPNHRPEELSFCPASFPEKKRPYWRQHLGTPATAKLPKRAKRHRHQQKPKADVATLGPTPLRRCRSAQGNPSAREGSSCKSPRYPSPPSATSPFPLARPLRAPPTLGRPSRPCQHPRSAAPHRAKQRKRGEPRQQVRACAPGGSRRSREKTPLPRMPASLRSRRTASLTAAPSAPAPPLPRAAPKTQAVLTTRRKTTDSRSYAMAGERGRTKRHPPHLPPGRTNNDIALSKQARPPRTTRWPLSSSGPPPRAKASAELAGSTWERS